MKVTGPLYGTVLIVLMISSSALFDTVLSYQFYSLSFPPLYIFNIQGQLIVIDVQSITCTINAAAFQAEAVQMAAAYALPCLWLREGFFVQARARR